MRSEYGCHIDLPEGEHDNCVLDGGNHDDCIYTRAHGEDGRKKCGEWKPIKIVAVSPSGELSASNARIAKLEALVAERDAMLANPPCQNMLCDELRAARALLYGIFWNGNLEEGSKVQQELDSRLGAYLDACDTLEGK